MTLNSTALWPAVNGLKVKYTSVNLIISAGKINDGVCRLEIYEDRPLVMITTCLVKCL